MRRRGVMPCRQRGGLREKRSSFLLDLMLVQRGHENSHKRGEKDFEKRPTTGQQPWCMRGMSMGEMC